MQKILRMILLLVGTAMVLLFSLPAEGSIAGITIQSRTITCPHLVTGHVREKIGDLDKGFDVLYLHGLGDNGEQHDPLGDGWVRDGYRFITVDLPSHGKTEGCSINCFNFQELADYVFKMDELVRQRGKDRPFVLAGWSTGGLLALRMVQEKMFERHFRQPSGMILYAPAIGPKIFIGNGWRITNRTLTRNPNPPRAGRIRPISPVFVPMFGWEMLTQSKLSQQIDLPDNLPTQMFLAGENTDYYVKTEVARAYGERQIDKGNPFWMMEFAGAYHELDNEPDPVGNMVRDRSASFARYVLEGTPLPAYQNPGSTFITQHY